MTSDGAGGDCVTFPGTALITGVAGQDGSYLAERLLTGGWDVHGMVHQEPAVADDFGPRRANFQGVHRHVGDLADPRRLDHLIHEIAPDVIFNLGGISSVYRSWQEPYLTSIVAGSAVVGMLESAWNLQELRGRQVRFFQASSAEIFGNAVDSPQTEESEIHPMSPYGAAKAFAHQAVGVYRNRGLFAATGILYNHESVRRPDTFVTRKITKGVAAISLGSADKLVLGNLQAVRDWGWAPDFVDAMVRVALTDKAEDYIIATGESHSVEEFLAAAFESVGIADWSDYVETDVRYVRPSDSGEMRGDNTKIRRRLGWEPTMAFAEIVKTMVAHDVARLSAGSRPESTRANNDGYGWH
jgi:GDPmannose 4,6-dehydratase